MKLKTIYGQEIDTDLIGNSFGDFGNYVRAHFDKEWGMSEKREAAGTKKYTVSLGGTATVCGYYNVDAHSEEEARELAIKQKSMIDWEIDLGTSVDDVEVFGVEECKE